MTSSLMTSFNYCQNMYSLSRNSCANAFGNWPSRSDLRQTKIDRGEGCPFDSPLEASRVN